MIAKDYAKSVLTVPMPASQRWQMLKIFITSLQICLANLEFAIAQ